MDKERERLLFCISEVSFCMDDIRLFLDTHPDNQAALALYREYGIRRSELEDKYTAKYGPLNSYNVNSQNYWAWVSYPWPWEGVC